MPRAGTDELIGRMPAGMLQVVGETGWQLSHGERSRLYIAHPFSSKRVNRSYASPHSAKPLRVGARQTPVFMSRAKSGSSDAASASPQQVTNTRCRSVSSRASFAREHVTRAWGKVYNGEVRHKQ